MRNEGKFKFMELMTMQLETKIYVLKGIFGLLTSMICITLDLRDIIGLMFGIAIYIISIPLIKRILKIKPLDLKAPEQLYINGLAPYLTLWLIPWIVAYTFRIPHPTP